MTVDTTQIVPTQLEYFIYYVRERQEIYHRRHVLKRKPPWTKNPLLQHLHLTENYRELDPGTKWVRKHILENPHLDRRDQLFNIMLYRLSGSVPGTMEQCGMPMQLKRWNWHEWDGVMRTLSAPLSNVYTVLPNVVNTDVDKIRNIAALFEAIQRNFKDIYEPIHRAQSAQEAYEVLASLPKFGPFLSYQVLIDLLYPIERLGGRHYLPFTRNDFVVAGPGARKGVELLYPPNTRGIKHEEVIRWVHNNQVRLFGKKFKWLEIDGKKVPLWLSDCQSLFCEFSKAARAKETGHLQRRYYGGV